MIAEPFAEFAAPGAVRLATVDLILAFALPVLLLGLTMFDRKVSTGSTDNVPKHLEVAQKSREPQPGRPLEKLVGSAMAIEIGLDQRVVGPKIESDDFLEALDVPQRVAGHGTDHIVVGSEVRIRDAVGLVG